MGISAIDIQIHPSSGIQPFPEQPFDPTKSVTASHASSSEKPAVIYEPTAEAPASGDTYIPQVKDNSNQNPTGQAPQTETGTEQFTSVDRHPTGQLTRPKQGTGSMELTPEEKQQVEELKARDAEVRRHEQAHVMAGGRYIRSRAQFDYVLGPDGKLYAVGGEVQIDTSEVPDDPEATIQKAQTIRRAALAPSDPSQQDRRVAAQASQMEMEARMELARERAEEAQEQEEEYNQSGQVATPQTEPILINLFA